MIAAVALATSTVRDQIPSGLIFSRLIIPIFPVCYFLFWEETLVSQLEEMFFFLISSNFVWTFLRVEIYWIFLLLFWPRFELSGFFLSKFFFERIFKFVEKSLLFSPNFLLFSLSSVWDGNWVSWYRRKFFGIFYYFISLKKTFSSNIHCFIVK